MRNLVNGTHTRATATKFPGPSCHQGCTLTRFDLGSDRLLLANSSL